MTEATVVIDIGKTNAKLALVDRATGTIRQLRTLANTVRQDGLYPHFDTDRLWDWILDGLGAYAREADVACIATTTHGGAVAAVGDDDLVLPILDYEFSGPNEVADAYRLIRGAFWETHSPDLPNGLNVGRQLFWLQENYPFEFSRAKAILFYPQYWVWRLTGALVCEPTSIGCHTDLWNPKARTFSRLAHDRGWDQLIPALVHPWDTAGTVRPDIAARTGLPATCRVVAGIHDSNASFLPHLLHRAAPFSVLSTGTWLVILAAGGSLEALDAARDCLANVDAFGTPVPSARFMAGREFQHLTGGDAIEPSEADLARVVRDGIMALPSFSPGTGPYGYSPGHWTVDPETLAPGERAAAASLYLALVASTCLRLTGASGPSIVEGPLSRNRIFLGALASIVDGPVIASPGATGTTEGAALLAAGPERAGPSGADPAPVPPLAIDIAPYRSAWRAAID